MKPAPQQHRSRATVERLLAAANEEFALHGVSGATTTSIADRAEVSVGSLYRFFADKSAIAGALSEQYLEEATGRFGPIVAEVETADDLVPALRRIVRAAADLQLTHAGYYRITEDLAPGADESPASGVRTTLVDLFAAILDQHGLGSSDAERRRVISLLTETVRHSLAVIGPSADDRDEQIAELEELTVGYFAHRLDLPL